jgi:hypothetical protein
MKVASVVSASSIVLILSGALLSGCATTKTAEAKASPCDVTQAVGSCTATVQRQGTKLVVCPTETSAATPVCMNATVNVKRAGRKAEPVQLMLQPNQCVPLNTQIVSADVGGCEAFAPRSSSSTQVAAE